MIVPIHLKRSDEWVYEHLLTLVAAKKMIGKNTSVSNEVLRIVKNYILQTKIGNDLDKDILK